MKSVAVPIQQYRRQHRTQHVARSAAVEYRSVAAAFGNITSTGNSIPRQMQFAAKLLF
jgi:hypothetical protein